MLHENAEEFGLAFDEPPLVERVWVEVGGGRRLSGLAWGSGTPELVLLHGGSQNAHTWDTVALALGRPQLALDLPGHGHSDAGAGGSLDLTGNAEDVAAAIRRLAPDARACVGMSLGGLVTLALAQQFPDLVRSVVLVDITPGVTSAKAKAITDFVGGPARFDDFDSILAWTVAHNPQRSLTSLRRGSPPQRVPARRRLLGLALPPARGGPSGGRSAGSRLRACGSTLGSSRFAEGAFDAGTGHASPVGGRRRGRGGAAASVSVRSGGTRRGRRPQRPGRCTGGAGEAHRRLRRLSRPAPPRVTLRR